MRLSCLIHVVNGEFPNYVHSLPTPDEIDIVKLGKGGAITTDTCNAAMKTRCILVNRIGGTVASSQYSLERCRESTHHLFKYLPQGQN